jgi:hypothetical protein
MTVLFMMFTHQIVLSLHVLKAARAVADQVPLQVMFNQIKYNVYIQNNLVEPIPETSEDVEKFSENVTHNNLWPISTSRTAV